MVSNLLFAIKIESGKLTSNSTKTSDELGSFLGLVCDDFQGSAKTLIIVCEPFQERLTLD